MVGLVGLEPTTPALSRRCSNQLSYRPFTQGAGRRSLTKPALSRHGGALPAHFDMLRSTTADKSGRSRSSAFGSARSRRRSCMQDRSPRCGVAVFQKGGDPAAPSDTATLLRLHPSYQSLLKDLPPLRVSAAISGATDSHGVTGGVYKARERIHPCLLIRDY